MSKRYRRLCALTVVVFGGGLGCGDVNSELPVIAGGGGTSGAAGEGSGPDAGAAPDPDIQPPPSSEQTPDDEASWVFDEGVLRTYELTLPADEWAALQASALEEQYVLADLQVDGETLPSVGLRFKGGFGTLENCFDEDGAQICPKLSMKLKFDELDAEQRLHGLKRLNFHSMLNDPSALHDRLAYRMFREMGIAAPRATHARLVINGEYRGLFSLVEEIDGRFTSSRFSPGDGNLYKQCWPTSTDPAAYGECLETNEDIADHSGMVAFAAALSEAAPEALASVVATYADPEQLLTYLAVDRTLNNWDGVTGFYCFGDGCENFNYYWYQQEDQARFTLVPWDLDQTFSLSNQFDAVPGPLELPEDCSTPLESGFGLPVQAPACDPLIGGLARGDHGPYRAALGRLVDGPFALDRVHAAIDAWQAQIEPAVVEDPFGPSVDAFHAAVAGLREDVRVLRLRAIAERDGAPIERFSLTPGGVEDFEAASPLAVGLGIARNATSTSDIAVSLSEGSALGGEHDLSVRVEMRDGVVPWAQWVQVRLPLAESAGLAASGHLRFRVSASGPRVLHIGIDSSAYSNRDASGEIGWDIDLDGTTQPIDLELASATFPDWGEAVPDTIEEILANATGLLLEPAAAGRDDEGWLGAGVVDVGEIHFDDIELAP
jgi:spore coat protein H